MDAYVGIKDGTIRAIVVDDPDDTDLTAEMLADWIKMGRTVERMTVEAAIERARSEKPKRNERFF